MYCYLFLHSFSFLLLCSTLDNFRRPMFNFTDSFFCFIKSAVDALSCSFHFILCNLQLQNLFYFFKDYYLSVKLLILFMCCFPDFTELSFSVFLLLSMILVATILNSLSGKLQLSVSLGLLTGILLVPLVVSHFLDH